MSYLRISFILGLLCTCLAMLAGCSPTTPRGPVIFAASSLQQPLEEAGRLWVRQGGEQPVFSFASSAALARQIESGSLADIFVSADKQWTEYVVASGRLDQDMVRAIAANRLVIARSIRDTPLGETGRGAALSALQTASTIATGDPDTVPLGRFAHTALQKLGIWSELQPRIIPAQSSQAALRLVLVGEADLGILYASDVARRDDLGALWTVPAHLHDPVVYRALQLPSSGNPQAADFLEFLSSPEAREIFVRNSFSAP